jgi:hypothetical protein
LIDEVQGAIEDMPDHLPAHPFPLEHEFADGIYRRTIHSPAGTLIVGFRHRFSHFFDLREGEISVLTEDGPLRVQRAVFVPVARRFKAHRLSPHRRGDHHLPRDDFNGHRANRNRTY